MALNATRRCVDHLCELLIVQCQGGLERKEGSELGLTEKLAKWGVSNGGAAAAGKALLGAAPSPNAKQYAAG